MLTRYTTGVRAASGSTGMCSRVAVILSRADGEGSLIRSSTYRLIEVSLIGCAIRDDARERSEDAGFGFPVCKLVRGL